jgi:hypothetical protein
VVAVVLTMVAKVPLMVDVIHVMVEYVLPKCTFNYYHLIDIMIDVSNWQQQYIHVTKGSKSAGKLYGKYELQ